MSLQTWDKDDKVMMVAFINGLRSNELYYKFAKKPPMTLEELLNRAHVDGTAEKATRLKQESEKDFEDRWRKNGTIDL